MARTADRRKPGPAPRGVELSEEERTVLGNWARRPKTGQALALRSKIILECSKGLSDADVASKLDVSRQSVLKWRNRFLKKRLEGLSDEPRPGAPRTISDSQVEELIRKTLEAKPRDATNWSLRSMAAEAGIHRNSVARIWHAFGLKPHLEETFKLSKDPQFIEKVRDIVGLYLDPPDRALVLCVDEKSQIQALDRTQPLLPMSFGHAVARTHDYERHGTTTLFAALDTKSGKVIGKCYRRHRTYEFQQFLYAIDRAVPKDLDVHLIMDNASTHKTDCIRSWMAAHPRYHVHFTPTSSSWINMVERFFAEITRKQIRRGTHRTTEALEKAILAYLDVHNENPRPFIWTKTADEILDSIKRFCLRISGPGH